MTEKEELQKKFVEYNVYKQQAEGLVQELTLLNSTATNLQAAKLTLGNIEKLEEKPEILVPIGGNTFLKANVKDTKQVLVGIGSDIIVKKDTGDAVQTIDDQLENLKDASGKIQGQISELDNKMKAMEPALQKMLAEAQKQKK